MQAWAWHAASGPMLSNRRLNYRQAFGFAMYIMVPAGLYAGFIFALHIFAGFHLLRIPFLPVATIGTAVAFYVGFKNNASYDRFWEGRKIWGGIVNASRTWSASVIAFVNPEHHDEATKELRRDLIYRHMAWMNALRVQLRATSRFFDKPAKATKRRLERHAEHMRNDWDTELEPFLDAHERELIKPMANGATQLLKIQGEKLAHLVSQGQLDLFRQLRLMEVIEELYALQGKAERIKATPFPRTYAEYSRLFVRVFAALIPLGMLDVFADKLGETAGALEIIVTGFPMVVASALVTWVFWVMEGLGDATEDPFERSFSDVPMNALCRVIERDLREMLGETEIPDKERAIDGVLY